MYLSEEDVRLLVEFFYKDGIPSTSPISPIIDQMEEFLNDLGGSVGGQPDDSGSSTHREGNLAAVAAQELDKLPVFDGSTESLYRMLHERGIL